MAENRSKPRLLLLNATCLDALAPLRPWLADQPVTFVADPAMVRMHAEALDAAVAGVAGLILPSGERYRFPVEAHMARHTSIQVLAIAASGHEWLDLDAATRHGIVVTHAPVPEGVEVVADQTFALMLAAARQVPHHHAQLRQGHDERGIGVSVWGKTLGIVGLGRIGQAVARRAAGFEMRVLASTPRPDAAFCRRYGVEVVPLDTLLQQADFVSLHTRLNPQTAGMIGPEQLARLKPSAMLINTARAELVNQAALADALEHGRLAGAGLDDPPAPEHRHLLARPNVVCTPHLGNRAMEGMVAVFRAAVADAVAVLHGRRPRYLLNPAVYDAANLRCPAPQPLPQQAPAPIESEL
ncbi:MAG: NAD(P)-dependent oxidoreductase [Phycisphaeraceae bacterium]